MGQTNYTKEQMDTIVLAYVRRNPNRRLAFIHHNIPLDMQRTHSTLRRLFRKGLVNRTFHSRGLFWYYTYTVSFGSQRVTHRRSE